MRAFFTYQSLTISYASFGAGDDVIFCFHGFGRKAEDFDVFISLLKKGQRMISMNLFAHEDSAFPTARIDKAPLDPEEWKSLIIAFCDQLGIRTFHLLGYSMGGRICLKTLEVMPEMVKSVILIAPDGFKVNPLYRFASGTSIGKALYRRLIKKPAVLFRIADLLHRSGLLNSKLHRFVYAHLDTREKRQLVHDAWLIYRLFFPNLKKTASIIRDKKIRFNMIFGRYDYVIRPLLGNKFETLLGGTKHLHILEGGHRLMSELTVHYIRQNGLWP